MLLLCPFINELIPLRPHSPDVSSTVVLVAETCVAAYLHERNLQHWLYLRALA